MYEELLASLSQVKAIINSRPISFLSADPEDIDSLTLTDFLLGKCPIALPPMTNLQDPTSTTADFRRRAQHSRTTMNQLWRRWKREYLLAKRVCQDGAKGSLPQNIGQHLLGRRLRNFDW